MFGITPIVVTSYIPSHPSTAIIEKTLKSLRFHMPTSPIFVMADGIRPEQSATNGAYIAYVNALAQSLDGLLQIHYDGKFRHQIGMMRKILPLIKTELLLFVEHDCPIVTDEPIDWYGCCAAIESGDVNLIRFLHEAHIIGEHEYLMREQIESHGVPLRKTIQFSARPHLATVEFYHRLLERFSPDAKCFVEDFAYSVCQTDPWENWKLSIYNPENNAKRSLHLDGRAGGEKFDASQKF